MSHTAKFDSFQVTTYEPLSLERENIFVNAVLRGRSAVSEAKRKTYEALGVLMRKNNDLSYLPPDFVLHVKTLLKCDTPLQVVKGLLDAGTALVILEKGLNSAELKFIEMGMDTVATIADKIAGGLMSLGVQNINRPYTPSTTAMVRGFTLTGGSYQSQSVFEGCLNTGKATGNPNAITFKLSAVDKGLSAFTDTVVHESTHKFLGTNDEGMTGAGLAFMADDGLFTFKMQYPDARLPIETPGFQAMGTTQALGNAYILTGYILYMPASEPSSRAEMVEQSRTGPLGSQTALGSALRQALASRPPAT